jgi:hypothetical protein
MNGFTFDFLAVDLAKIIFCLLKLKTIDKGKEKFCNYEQLHDYEGDTVSLLLENPNLNCEPF